jgi:hypothetical protein
VFIAVIASAFAARPITPPRESVEVVVEDVTPAGGQHLVFLTDPARTHVVPLQVGEAQAIAVAFRLAERTPPQPHTHDLFEALSGHLGARLAHVHIHSLDGGDLAARLTYQVKRKRIDLEARASDAIVLAVGRSAPIYMSMEVYESTAVAVADLRRVMEEAGRSPAELL